MIGPTPPSPFPSFPVPPQYADNGAETEPDPMDAAEPQEQEPQAPADPLALIDDGILLQIVNEGKHRALQARLQRQMQNRRNWRAVHGIFEFLSRKQPGQSKIVIPALETSLEQVCAELCSQLVGFEQWFDAEYVDEPPIPELVLDDVTKLLAREMDRLAIEGNYLESSYGVQRLVFDSIKVGLIESVITWKVTIHEDETSSYGLGVDPTGPPSIATQTRRRLKVEIVPFDDHYPDPSPGRMFDIHEAEVAIADLPAMGFTEEEIGLMRGNVSSEKEEQRRVRAGTATGVTGIRNRVILREYWGKLVHPTTGEFLDPREVMFLQCGTSLIVRKPVPITDILWHGRRPLISFPLLPTPLSHIHHAFLDIAIPLVETESELFNLVIDGGFSSVHGIKQIRSYALNNPEVLSKGLIPGITLDIAEQYGNVEKIVDRVDTGTLAEETITVLDRASRTREEAFRINSLQLGQFAPRKSSATEITQVAESTGDLFSAMGERIECGGTNALVELAWLTYWQFCDDFSGLSPEHRTILDNMSPQERFVLMANGVKFKAIGYKQLQAAAKEFQKLVTYENLIAQNPAYQQADAMAFDPAKKIRFAYRALGIDANKLARDANSPPPPPPMQPGMPPGMPPGPQAPGNPADQPNLAQATESVNPPNASGFRGSQEP